MSKTMTSERESAQILVRMESPRTVDAARLLDEAFAELALRYPEYSRTEAAPFPVEQAEQARAVFLVARLAEGAAVGCVVVRPISGEGVRSAEFKRMFVMAEARGRGVGSALVIAAERAARSMGYASIRLETGFLQPEAMALYEKHGFVRIPCWGSYAHDPESVCYEKVLTDPDEH